MTIGVRGNIVDVEADVSAGLPTVLIVGLADAAVGEARARVRSAITNSELGWPTNRVTIGLSPASLHKRGSGLDLAIALAILTVTEQIPPVDDLLAFGELGLDGRTRPVRGVIVAASAARDAGLRRCIVPTDNAAEAALVTGIDVVAVRSLAHAAAVLRKQAEGDPVGEFDRRRTVAAPDFADVRGHGTAKTGFEIAAAGSHHLSMIGPPGIGKTLLAERMPGILPELDDDDALDVTSIASILGEHDSGLVRTPPFVAPHHTVSKSALIGGGNPIRPGMVTRAHRGVLFIDEAPEFDRACLDTLRQPLETGMVIVSKGQHSVRMPAAFQLILAANPCPCGQDSDVNCTCSSMERRRYRNKLSGPLLDRIDIRLTLTKPSVVELGDDTPTDSSDVIAARVACARDRARARFAEDAWSTNAEIPPSALRRRWSPTDSGAALLARAVGIGRLGMRGADRVLRVAWSIADLNGLGRPDRDCIATAMSFRGSDAP